MGLIARRALTALLCALPAARGPRAQDAFPGRPIRLISPFAPGGAIDVLNRLIAEQLAARLGQPVVVDARPGANTIVGAEALARSAPDGHTIMITTSSTMLNNPALFRDLPYDPARDFSPISLLSMGTVLLAAPSRLPFADLAGGIAWIRAQGRPVTYGSWGVGSGGHLFGELLKRRNELQLEHIPYRGEQAAIADVLAGRLDMTFASPVGARPQIEAGALRGIAQLGERRSPALPDVPTFGEQGQPGFDLPIFVAAYAPAGTPPAVVARWQTALAQVLAEGAVRERLLAQGQTPVASSPEELAAIQRRDLPRWAELIRLSGARVE
ncbi:MAG TPA: tripartite tricarboxylate transporter substrate binding protein [Acetobacteraceae bacterium]|nr:tripartite tricarboxylate transporter substrate binding protein [Acetobacteraceae bacterium]